MRMPFGANGISTGSHQAAKLGCYLQVTILSRFDECLKTNLRATIGKFLPSPLLQKSLLLPFQRFASDRLRRLLLRILILCLPLPLLLFAGCEQGKEEQADLIILHSGRIRGNVYPLELQDIAPLQHYQFLAGYVEKVRQEAETSGAEVLLLDLGDSLQGSFASYVTDSGNVVDFFNHLAYDAVLLGNLDNQVGRDTLQDLKPIILSPFTDSEGRPVFPDVWAGGKIRGASGDVPPVYLLANFYGNTEREEFPDRFPTAFGPLLDGTTPVRDHDAILDSLGELPPDSLLLFAWLKFEAPENPPRQFLASLRELGVNAILAQRVYGSSQRDVWSSAALPGWDPPVSQNILRNNGGFTLARMDLKRDGNEWKVLRQELVPMTANSAPANEKILQVINQFAEKIRRADRVVAELPSEMSEGEILISYLRAQTSLPDADVILYSPQSIRSSWPAGPLSVSRVFNSLPWTTPVVRVSVNRKQLNRLLKENTGWVFWARDEVVDSTAAPSKEIQLVASRFFASILLRQLALPSAGMIEEVVPSEFDFYLNFLEQDPSTLTPELPDGWQLLSPPSKRE